MPSRLTRLELHGYKTFASRTEFQFAPSVTAIVGPNGSGKSNIADAVRWVLGEQAYSTLRGKRTEDMIFAGSQSRSPAGLASVLITFDNADGWLPIEFAEVSVGRRAYRDGKNEYLINGQRVRLRDITELLARCGLGERTYNIVGQGLVDSALSLRAEDRRALFEEAAGIGLQRQKREEALRRLQATRHNLERVEDILAELRPRLRGLERQARRAGEYEQVRTDLKALLRVWYGYHWHAAQQELLAARKQAEQAERQRAALLQHEQALEAELAARRGRIAALRGQLAEWQRELARQIAEREALGRDLAVAGERARALAEAREQAAAEIVALQAALTGHQGRLGAAEGEHAALQDEAAEAARQSQAAQARLHAHETRRAALRQEQNAARRTLESLTDRLAEVRVRRSQFGQRREQLAARRESAASGVTAAEATVQAQADALETAGGAHQRAAQASDQAQAAREAGQAHIGEQETRLAKLSARLRELGGQEARLRARHEVLTQAERKLEGYASGAQGLLAAGREGRLAGLRGALNQTLSVPARVETALAAALGSYLEAVVLEAGADLEAVLEQLDRPEAGRAALLPLGSLNPPAPAPPPPDPDVIGAAAALVSVPDPVRAGLEMLLANVIVVRDRAAARRLAPGLPPGGAAVTLAGEVFFAAGPILAGGAESPRPPGARTGGRAGRPAPADRCPGCRACRGGGRPAGPARRPGRTEQATWPRAIGRPASRRGPRRRPPGA
ncbi:MAG: AAA family ATPase [Chloroflexi bacterium]|nr:AAA family ATPase [Chloroflexota bacterium]